MWNLLLHVFVWKLIILCWLQNMMIHINKGMQKIHCVLLKEKEKEKTDVPAAYS